MDEIKVNPPFPQSFKDRQPDTDLIIVDLNRRWDANFFERFPKLKAVVSCTTGLDHIDTDYCREKGIKVISLKGETDFLQDVYATAEHTWALILSLIRKVPFAHQDVCRGNWNREAWQGTELHGKRLGIIGLGRVGSHMCSIAEVFGMTWRFYDPSYTEANKLCWHYHVSLDELLRSSDIITVHVPLDESTRGMFGAEQFAMMKPTSYFVNTSRGAIVQEDALLWALIEKKIAGAALDVVNDEPQIYHALKMYINWSDKHNLIITPHIAGNTAESREKTQLFISHKIKEFILGGG